MPFRTTLLPGTDFRAAGRSSTVGRRGDKFATAGLQRRIAPQPERMLSEPADPPSRRVAFATLGSSVVDFPTFAQIARAAERHSDGGIFVQRLLGLS